MIKKSLLLVTFCCFAPFIKTESIFGAFFSNEDQIALATKQEFGFYTNSIVPEFFSISKSELTELLSSMTNSDEQKKLILALTKDWTNFISHHIENTEASNRLNSFLNLTRKIYTLDNFKKIDEKTFLINIIKSSLKYKLISNNNFEYTLKNVENVKCSQSQPFFESLYRAQCFSPSLYSLLNQGNGEYLRNEIQQTDPKNLEEFIDSLIYDWQDFIQITVHSNNSYQKQLDSFLFFNIIASKENLSTESKLKLNVLKQTMKTDLFFDKQTMTIRSSNIKLALPRDYYKQYYDYFNN